MDLKKITSNLFKKKKKFTKEGFAVNPSLYWRFILTLAFFIIVLSFLFGFYLLNQLNKPFVPNGDDVSGVNMEATNEERLNKILDYFKEREAISEQIIKEPASIKDPSI